MLTKSLLAKYQKFAEELVHCSGEIIRKNKNKIKITNYKDRQDIVTNIDLEIETKIIHLIETSFPKHNIISEELGEIDKGSDLTWIIDPLDGTKEFIRGIPLYCSAVCLEKAGEIKASAIYDPSLDELYSASFANGARLNGESIKVSQTKNLQDSLFFVYLHKDEKSWDIYQKLNKSVYRIRGHANHNLSSCWVAKGGYEGQINLFFRSKWWDIAPGFLILKEAGGMVTDLRGSSVNHKNYQDSFIGTNGLVHQDLLEIINKSL